MSQATRNFFRSGELAQLAGVSTDTLRHYERKGVLPRPHRSASGYREYPNEALDRVRLIRRALAVGFTLDELARLLKARARGQAPCREVHALAATKLAEIEQQLSELTAVRDELRATLQDWDRRLSATEPNQPARLLEALATTESLITPVRTARPRAWNKRKKE